MTKKLPPKPDFQHGIYRHYKSGMYETLGLVLDADRDVWVVLYRRIPGIGPMFTRSIDEWHEIYEHKGTACPRFSLIAAYNGAQMEIDMSLFKNLFTTPPA